MLSDGLRTRLSCATTIAVALTLAQAAEVALGVREIASRLDSRSSGVTEGSVMCRSCEEEGRLYPQLRT